MELKECTERRAEAGRLLNEHTGRDNGLQVATSLADGIVTIRNLLFTRIHEDVESKIGLDSMLLPLSPLKSEMAAKLEIELFCIAESSFQAQKYVPDVEWYVAWLTRLRLGDDSENPRVQRRIAKYRESAEDARRLLFSTYLERAYPEARRAPLVLYRLFPLAVRIVTAVAFGNPLDANDLRNRQSFWLPSIPDCNECHGATLDNGEKCRICGNPVWSYRWLTVAD